MSYSVDLAKGLTEDLSIAEKGLNYDRLYGGLYDGQEVMWAYWDVCVLSLAEGASLGFRDTGDGELAGLGGCQRESGKSGL